MSKSIAYLAVWAGVLLATRPMAAEQGPAFSELPRDEQYKIRRLVEPPPPAKRYGCYSTPMYYLMYEGYTYDGSLDEEPDIRQYEQLKDKKGPNHGHWKLDRNRPDWQEAMIRDWAELGLNSTHLNIYPSDDRLILSDSLRQAIEDFVRLSTRHGLKVGVRLDALGSYEAWEMHPDNPDNLIEPYLRWAAEVAGILKGHTLYYVLGDELTLHKSSPDLSPRLWTPEKYLSYFQRVSEAIKAVDPEAKVSMFAASSGEWFNVLYLLEIGYARHGDAVAINYYNYQDVPRFFDDARRLVPELMFLSNGVGYTSGGFIEPRYPEWDPYHRHPTEESHGNEIAKNMFAWWDLGASAAPYYISLRNWVMRGKVYPRWYGFFGFQDFVVDEHDNMTVKRYPGWYAFQSVAHTFYNRKEFKPPSSEVSSSAELTMFRAYEREITGETPAPHLTGETPAPHQGGSELVMMLWNDPGDASTTITLPRKAGYRYPVRISTFNYHEWADIPYEVKDDTVTFNLEVNRDPTIIRLVRSSSQ